MPEIKEKLQQLVSNFKEWLFENYTGQEIAALTTDDAGYSKWDEINKFFSELLNKDLFQALDEDDLTGLLYLIARNSDIGNMIAWISRGKQLSNLGDLSQADFIILAKRAAALTAPEYNDAKSQIAACFSKFPELTPETESILLKLYTDKDEYTKRRSLMSLGKLGYNGIRNLISESWATVNDENHKMACLGVINDHLNDNNLMKEYLLLADTEEGEHLKTFAAGLRNGNYRLL